jgi:hypothetical protein
MKRRAFHRRRQPSIHSTPRRNPLIVFMPGRREGTLYQPARAGNSNLLNSAGQITWSSTATAQATLVHPFPAHEAFDGLVLG